MKHSVTWNKTSFIIWGKKLTDSGLMYQKNGQSVKSIKHFSSKTSLKTRYNKSWCMSLLHESNELWLILFLSIFVMFVAFTCKGQENVVEREGGGAGSRNHDWRRTTASVLNCYAVALLCNVTYYLYYLYFTRVVQTHLLVAETNSFQIRCHFSSRNLYKRVSYQELPVDGSRVVSQQGSYTVIDFLTFISTV